jgi:hypothetical protein
MIQENDIIPKFKLDISKPGATANSEEFHERILEFITKNINGEINHTILCYFVSVDGTHSEAELPRKAYNQALSKSLEFFTEIENYEKCKTIKELTEKL